MLQERVQQRPAKINKAKGKGEHTGTQELELAFLYRAINTKTSLKI